MSAEAWVEVRALVPHGWEELVAGILSGAGCQGAREGSSAPNPAPLPLGMSLVRSHFRARADSPERREALCEAVASLGEIDEELRAVELSFRELPPEDYAKSWKKVWRPFRCGKLAVVAPWTEAALRPGDVRMELEPGGVFGTGRHATTRMILSFLQERLRGGERVLDCGSGTGILAVAARLLGAREAAGFDIDEGSAAVATDLAERNGVGAGVTFLEGDFSRLSELSPPYEVVLANLYSDLLLSHASELEAALAPEGWLCVSGLNASREEAVTQAMSEVGLSVTARRARGVWRCLILERR
ncbi:MAG: 50S ribosomal protein L11 methyltransferase [Planctomycetes bacterium]|nr:50S ribosomal protein L11 methyltransferase [Planctomycetota bacterium]